MGGWLRQSGTWIACLWSIRTKQEHTQTMIQTSCFAFSALGVCVLTFHLASRLGAGELAGQKLLTTSIRTGDTEVFIVDPDTGDAVNVSRSPQSEDRYPCWSPDGKRIAFTSDRNHSTNLYVMRADGSGLKRIVNSPAVCYMPSWQRTPRGECI